MREKSAGRGFSSKLGLGAASFAGSCRAPAALPQRGGRLFFPSCNSLGMQCAGGELGPTASAAGAAACPIAAVYMICAPACPRVGGKVLRTFFVKKCGVALAECAYRPLVLVLCVLCACAIAYVLLLCMPSMCERFQWPRFLLALLLSLRPLAAKASCIFPVPSCNRWI